MIPVSTQQLPIEQTGAFSAIVQDYVHGAEALKPFYQHAPTLQGLKDAIESRQQFNSNRQLLYEILQRQYAGVTIDQKLAQNISLLQQETTFTITTAHQPNIFTGHLYFIYKILHCIKLAGALKAEMPDLDFVPVFYMGSEDADIEELGEVIIDGRPYRWNTPQQGAVGRMQVDKAFVQLMDDIESQVAVYPFGAEIMQKMKAAYLPGQSIEQATFALVHDLFASYGLVVFLPDSNEVKRAFSQVMQEDLFTGFSHIALEKAVAAFPEKYKVQAAGRQINLFYLFGNERERIVRTNGGFASGDKIFSDETILEELQNFPERFSPNVILRPLLQEFLLPNIAFVGGGGEIAYWLELKAVFEAKAIPFPVLILRNSFMLMEPKAAELAAKLALVPSKLFQSTEVLLQEIVQKNSHNNLSLQDAMQQLQLLYYKVQAQASAVDATLSAHAEALCTQALKKMQALEKKMLRSEKRKFDAQQRQLQKLKNLLFPGNGLQERVDNIIPFYARFGWQVIDAIYAASPTLETCFTILELQQSPARV